MRFGKDIKIASLLDYKDYSLVFVKYTALDKDYKPIFDDGKHVVYENMLLNDVLKEAEKHSISSLYLVTGDNKLFSLAPFKIYSDEEISNRIDELNEKSKVKVK